MIYLSGCVRPELLRQPDMGLMLTPLMGNAVDLTDTLWAADTGCFAQPDAFDESEYLAWLSAHPSALCLFATAPDVVGDARTTWEWSRDVLPKIRELGYRAALVAQDGIEDIAVEWDTFDALFVGGSTAWKLSETAYRVAREADARGKWTHMGRVNSWRRLKAAAVSGYDSADGTYLKFGPDVLMPQVQAWVQTLRREPVL